VPSLYLYLLYVARDEIVFTKPETVNLEVVLPGDAAGRQRSLQQAQSALDAHATPLPLKRPTAQQSQGDPLALPGMHFLRRPESLRAMAVDAATHSFSAVVARQLGFLHGAYRREFYYWEVVETLRRLLLTAVVSVVGTGSALQVRVTTSPLALLHTQHDVTHRRFACRLCSASSSRSCS